MAVSSRQVFTDDFSLPPSPPLTNSTASRGLGQLLTFYFLLLLFLYPLLLLSPFLTAPLPSTLTLSFASLLRSFHVHALVIFLVNPLPPFALRSPHSSSHCCDCRESLSWPAAGESRCKSAGAGMRFGHRLLEREER